MARDMSATWQTHHILHRKLGFQIRNGYVQNIGTHLRDNQTDMLLGVRQRWRIEVHLELERSQQSVVVILRWEACIYSCEEMTFYKPDCPKCQWAGDNWCSGPQASGIGQYHVRSKGPSVWSPSSPTPPVSQPWWSSGSKTAPYPRK